MNTKTFSLKKFILTCLIIYICALILCIFFSLTVYRINSRILISNAELNRNYYTKYDSFREPGDSNNSDELVYSSDLKLINSRLVGEYENNFDYRDLISRHISRLDNNETVYTMIYNSQLRNHFAIVIILPMENGNYYLFAKELYSFNMFLMILFIIVKVVVFLCALYILLIVRKYRSIEKMQRNYVDNISHELKTPLTSLRALTETLSDGLVPEEEERREYYQIMLNELDNLTGTVSEMLELSRIQNQKDSCPKSSCQLTEVFRSVVSKYTVICEDLGIRFTSDLSESDIQPETNPDFASRLLEILLDNAVKFCQTGEDATWICVNHKEYPGYLKICVANSGQPINPKDQSLIFNRFYQGDKSHSGKGSGLGLAIAREIASCLNETIRLEKSGPEGTEFSFTITLRKAF